MSQEIISKNNPRMSIFPIIYSDIWKFYEDMLKSFWFPSEINFSHDDIDLVDPVLFNTIKTILAFFNSSDVLVAYDILPELQQLIPDHMLEMKFFYALQASVENIHSTTYS